MDWMLMPLYRYAEFSGRSRRKEYWMFVLMQWLVAAAVGLLVILLYVTAPTESLMMAVLKPPLVLAGLFALACFIPGIALTVRRLHDTGRSGWNLSWGLLPFLGGFILLYFCVSDGDPGPNRFGEDPKEESMTSLVYA
jgi:uncharacterized membrane protein YhaH (DUF805 family)